MRIALLGSVSTIIPPIGQAAIEKLAYQQALGLADRGHEILLFAPRESTVSHRNIRLIDIGSGETRSGVGAEAEAEAEAEENSAYGTSYKLRLEILHLANVIQNLDTLKDDYDVVLNNLRGEAVLLPVINRLKKPMCHIMHLPIFPELANLFKYYNTPLISISDAQRKEYPDLNYVATVYNCVDTVEFPFSAGNDDYMLYLGSIGPNKNPADAVKAALLSGHKIYIGGRIKNQAYYDKEIAPHIDGEKVIWVGEINHSKLVRLYQKAKAFLFPTLWEEPFGLVAIEAMSCGTPVIAYPNGAVPEIISNGVNGFLVRDVNEIAEKIKSINQIDRKRCRQDVIDRFSIKAMIDGYEAVLQSHTRVQFFL